MNSTLPLIGKWLSIFLAIITIIMLLFGQLYTVQFFLLAYVFNLLSKQDARARPKFPVFLFVAITVLSSFVTAWMGYVTWRGFSGFRHYPFPSIDQFIWCLGSVLLGVLTLALYAKALKRFR